MVTLPSTERRSSPAPTPKGTPSGRLVAVVGAGPYGLGVAAHLRRQGVPVVVFGEPMATWRNHMSERLCLESTADGSSLAAPVDGFTLADFYRLHGLGPTSVSLPVPNSTFVDYGLWFQQRLVPEIEPGRVTRIRRGPSGLCVETTGGVAEVSEVVVATGLVEHPYIPPELAPLGSPGGPADPLSHSVSLPRLLGGRLRGRIAVIGAGQSALEAATLLGEEGAEVTLVARTSALRWGTPPTEVPPGWRDRHAPLGGGWSGLVACQFPSVLRRLPPPLRQRFDALAFRPAGAWWTADRFQGTVEVLLDRQLVNSRLIGGRVELTVRQPQGHHEVVRADHVVAATGYRVDLMTSSLLDAELQSSLRLRGGSPVLSKWFESNVAGLFFVGLPAAASFGPVMRFLYGAHLASRRVATRLR